MFAFSFNTFFENLSESHPLAKIEVISFSPKEVKSSDFDQSGTIHIMMEHNSRRKFYFLLLAMMFKFAINNDRIRIYNCGDKCVVELICLKTLFVCSHASDFRLERPGYFEVLKLSEQVLWFC